MTPVIISPESTDAKRTRYVAIARHGAVSSHGNTAGEALDALTAQLPEAERDFVFVVQQQTRPDAFFGEAQIARLRDLTTRANAGETLTEEQIAERFTLMKTRSGHRRSGRQPFSRHCKSESVAPRNRASSRKAMRILPCARIDFQLFLRGGAYHARIGRRHK